MVASSAFLVALLAAAAAAEPNSGSIFGGGPAMRLRHSRPQPPKAFRATTPILARPDEQLNLRVHLKKGDRAGLEAKLLEVSTPGHENYGKHLSKDEARALHVFRAFC